jgi:hypothetical protein
MDTALLPLARFRAELYHRGFGLRRDALMDLLDAVLTGEHATSLVRLSLAPGFRRQWPSTCDALSAGTLDEDALHHRCGTRLPSPPATSRRVWVIDGSIWPRPEAQTSPQRTFGRVVTPGLPTSGIGGAWEYQWLVALPDPTGSWILPLDVSRRGPTAGSATAVARAQVQTVLAAVGPAGDRPVIVLDSHYDLAALIQAELAVDWLGRLACNRRFYRVPPPDAGKGRPRRHGPVFRLGDPTTQGDPCQTQTWTDPAYGQVTITCWDHLHAQATPTVELTVLRIAVTHLPRRETPPAPLWLAWHGAALPADLRDLWHWYQRRFAIEHGFRFLKQSLGWTMPLLRAPEAADRWSWLMALALWQLWLARALVAEARLPWEHPPVAATPSSPSRVRRAMAGLFLTFGSPARLPQPRGKSPGRRVGQCPGRARRYPIQRRAPPALA